MPTLHIIYRLTVSKHEFTMCVASSRWMQANPCPSLRNSRIRVKSSQAASEHFTHPVPALDLSQELFRKTPERSANNTNCSEGQMPSWEKAQCTRKTKTRYAPDVTYRCLLRKDCAAAEFIRTKSPVSHKGKRPSEQQRLKLTDTLLITFSDDSQKHTEADEAAVSHGRAAHSEVRVPDFPLTVDSHHRSPRFKKTTNLLLSCCPLSTCCCYINKTQHFIIAALLKHPSAPRP